MKKARLFLFCAFAALLAYADAANLIENPSLEDANPDDRDSPMHFPRHIRDRNLDVRYVWCGEAARSGAKGLQSRINGNCAALSFLFPVKSVSNNLYRFSFWYKTQSDRPAPKCLSVKAGSAYFYYGTSDTWKQAHLFFPEDMLQDDTGLYVNLVGSPWGEVSYRKDGQNGGYLLDALGNKMLNNPMAFTAHLDDFELRKLVPDDFKGNLTAGDFENSKPGDMPADWSIAFGTGDMAVGAKESHSGRGSLKIGSSSGSLYGNYMPLKENTVYRLSFWAKCSKMQTPVMLRLLPMQKNNNLMEPLWVKPIRVDEAWSRYQFFLETPKQKYHSTPNGEFVAAIMFRFSDDDAVVWLDDVCFQMF